MRVSRLRVRDNEDFSHGLDVEARLFARTAGSDDSREGFAAFVEKRDHGSPTPESRVLSKRRLDPTPPESRR